MYCLRDGPAGFELQGGTLRDVSDTEQDEREKFDGPEHERWSWCDGSPLERAISDIVEEVRAHESDDDLMKMYNEAKKARNHTYTTRPTLKDLMNSLKTVL